jgi:hypothetical protein
VFPTESLNLRPQAKELLALIDAYAGEDAESLRTSLPEIEYRDAPLPKRREAKEADAPLW